MASDHQQHQPLAALPTSKPRLMTAASSNTQSSIDDDMFLIRELTAREVAAVSGGPQIINDTLIP